MPRIASQGTAPAFLLDMNVTMVDSMPWHARSWAAFARDVDALVAQLMRA